MHHRATGCPDQYPRKLVRTTVSNDWIPTDAPREGETASGNSGDGDVEFDLSQDRINAEYPLSASASSSATAVGREEL